MRVKKGHKIFQAVKLENECLKKLSFCLFSCFIVLAIIISICVVLSCVGILILRRIILLRLVQYAVEIAIAKHAYVWMYLLKSVSHFLTFHESVVFPVMSLVYVWEV